MRLVLISEQPGHNRDMSAAARRAGWSVADDVDHARAQAVCARLRPDAAIVVAGAVDERVLQVLHAMGTACPLPVVLYTPDVAQTSIRAAVAAGVSAYAADCSDVNRIGALLELAVARFAELDRLKKELQRVKTSMAERNAVEKAKGIIMRQRRISEDEAYRLLRKLAMDRNRRIGEVAGEVIALAGVLI